MNLSWEYGINLIGKAKLWISILHLQAGKGGDLTHDETTIIAGALEMTAKTAKDAMTPIAKAFSIDLDGTLNL